ncbi:hypothetical protein PR202_ga27557 [Eleusine coracana subsp. coracana]|uniref:NB-ARC domain-containing protein n=1 Tax=Eleusine coracana subsp. coracana TaxID=191504 RepID=A0AAV5DGA0_ELECO|nr:hypothetical protein PR202_ga27557 [Eleusine coracana subsp. coracana]
MDLLTKESAADGCSTRYSGVAIVGHAGAGKSTLAQHIYNDDRIKEHFEVRMWVCIWREIDVHRHTQGIIESAQNWKCPHFDNLAMLQQTLKGILQKSKKFLLVLDDVWFKESSKEKEWDLLLRPLVSQQAGSKVLVTSVRDVLPAALCCNEVIRLEDMDDADFLALFKHHAFSGAEIRDQWLQLQLEEIAEKIAKRLGRSPLAAKVIGSQLSRRKVINAWKDALMINNLSEPMRALLWSYEKLDPNLQRCFLYCSLFPKGYSYDINELDHLWVAEGLVVSYNHSKSMEDIGRESFNELVSGSFFQQLVSGRFVMHDLLHDLAELLSTEDCFRLEDDKVTQIPHTVRHLSVRVESMIKHTEIICKLNHLRTVICIEPLMDDACVLFDEILQNMKKLRVLYLSLDSSSKLPESIGDLKHLRYLNMVKTSISELPTSIYNLYHLQLLQLNHRVKHLPEKFCELSKLRHLQVYDGRIDETSERALPLFPNISKLTSLQQLHEFSVQRKKGYDLEQLRDMNELGGNLRVTNLENVSGKHEALDSNLHKKNRLRKLHLAWSSQNPVREDDSQHLDVLEGFVPPSQLNILTIEGYNSASYPSWLLDASCLESLNSFGLINCSMLRGLPPDTRHFRHCYELSLHNVPNLKTLSVIPPGLRSLTISRCPMLMFITHDELEQDDNGGNVINKDHLESHLALLWEVDSRSYMSDALREEYFSLMELRTLMDEDISNHLLMIKQYYRWSLVYLLQWPHFTEKLVTIPDYEFDRTSVRRNFSEFEKSWFARYCILLVSQIIGRLTRCYFAYRCFIDALPFFRFGTWSRVYATIC